MNEKGTNFCSFSAGLEPATPAYEAVRQSILPPRCGLTRTQESRVLAPLKRRKNLCLLHSFIIPPISIYKRLLYKVQRVQRRRRVSNFSKSQRLFKEEPRISSPTENYKITNPLLHLSKRGGVRGFGIFLPEPI